MRVLIIGNGITGVTAALRLREKQPAWEITMISGESRYHYSRPALMYIYMGHQSYEETKPYPDSFWAEQRIELVRDWVTRVDAESHTVTLAKNGTRGFDKLLLCTGSKPNKFGWPGQDLEGVQGFYGLQDLVKLYENSKNTRDAVIVGGGLIGIELGEMLHSAGIHVTFLVRESQFWNNVLPLEEATMVSRLIRKSGYGLELETNLTEIVDDGNGHCCAVTTDTGKRLECQLVGLTAGVSPRIEMLADSKVETERGVLVDWSLRTNVPDVYAAGDCAELVTSEGERNVTEQVWYTGKYQGEVVADVMAGEERRYEQGIWHNAAKFLDLEYQVYGRVNLDEEGVSSLYWEAPDGEHSIRIVHKNGAVIGFNLMGVRYRQETCQRWLREERDLDFVLQHLSEANFDPEFFEQYESALVAQGRGVQA